MRGMLATIGLGAVLGLLTGYLTSPWPLHRADGLTYWLGNYSGHAVTWAALQARSQAIGAELEALGGLPVASPAGGP